MNYALKNGYKPSGEIYILSQEEINKLVNEYVKEKVGIELNLKVSCLDEEYDVYIEWNEEEEIEEIYSDEQLKKIEELGLQPEEDFINRDNLIQAIFGSKDASIIALLELQEETYEVFVPYN